MQFETEYNNFNMLLTTFLRHSTAASSSPKGQVQALSRQLSAMAKQPQFLQVAMAWLVREEGVKERVTLVTSLIKDKFKFEFEMVEQEKLLYYYNKICEIGHLLGCKHYAVYTNLGLALVYLYLHLSGHSEHPLQSFLSPFVPTLPQHYQYFNFYFKILECLAVEVDNSKFVIDEQCREAARGKLLAQQYDILLQLNQNAPIAWEIPEIDNENILQCFTEWITIHYNPQVLDSLPHHSLTPRLFLHPTHPAHTTDTSDCLKQLVRHLRDPADAPLFHEYLCRKMVDLVAVVDQLVEQGEVGEAEDYLSIVVEFSRKAVPSLVRQFDDSIHSFLTKLVDYTEENIVPVYDHLIDFWEELLKGALEERKRRELHPHLAQLVGSLYTALCQQCHYPLKTFLQLDTRHQHKLYEYSDSAQQVFQQREASEKVFELMGEFFGKQAYLAMAYAKIEEVSTKSDQYLWPFLEVHLFSLVDALRKVPSITSEVQNIVNIYLQLSRKEGFTIPTIIRKTFLRIFRSLMTVQLKDPPFIKMLFGLTAASFPLELAMPLAQKTFERGCEDNYRLMEENAEEILSLLQTYYNREHIVRGIVCVVCHSEELALKYLPPILAYLLQKLQESAPNRPAFKQMMYSLTGAIRVLEQEAPENAVCISVTTSFLRSAFPFLLCQLGTPRNLEDDADDEVERMVKLLKHAMRYLKLGFTEFIEPLYGCVLQCFPRYPINSYAYLVEVAITVFYKHPQHTEYLKGVFVRFCGTLYLHLRDAQSIERYSFLFDDFVGVSKRFFLYNASILLGSGELGNIIQLCTNAFTASDTPRVAKGAYSFFETVFMVYWRQEFIDRYNSKKEGQRLERRVEDACLYLQLKALLLQKLEFILCKIMEHLSQAPYESTRHHILEVLTSQIKAFPEENVLLWPKILAMLPPDILVNNEKARFANTLPGMLSPDFAVVKTTTKQLKKYIYLINKRMVAANNRKLKI